MTDEYVTYDDLDANDSELHDGDEREVVRADRAPRRTVDDPRNREQRRAQKKKAKKSQTTARRREAEGVELVAVDFDGNTYWVPSDPSDWPVDALLGFEDGKAITALRALLEKDEDGVPGFETLMKTRPRVRQLRQLFEMVARVGGFESSGN